MQQSTWVAMLALGFLFVETGCLLAQDTQAASTAPPRVGDVVPDFDLKTLDGKTYRLKEHLPDATTVIVVLRGFPGYQCPLCTRQVADFLSNAAAFRQKQAHVVFVYPGPAGAVLPKAKEFMAPHSLPEHFVVTLDPDYKMLKQYALRWDARNETAYPATFVVDSQGKVLFAKVSRSHGDRSSAKDVLSALPSK